MEKMFLTAVVIALFTLTARGQDQPPGPTQEEQDEALQNTADAEAADAQEEECGGENPPASCMQKHFFSAKPYKLIYDNNCGGGKWIKVHYDECPIAFDDPDFSHHEYLCKGGSSSRCGAKTEGMWTWPEYGYCESVPVCIACPKLGDCDEWASPSQGGSSTTVIISTNTGGHHQVAEMQELLALLERGEALSRWQITRLETLSATATGLSRWQMRLISNVLDQHRGQGGHGGHQVHGGHGGHGGHQVHGGHGGHHSVGVELQHLLDLAARGASLSVSDVRRIQTLATNEMNLSFEQNRLIQSLVDQTSSHGTHGGWQGGHGGHHGQGLHGHGGGRQELEDLINLADRGSSLSRWQVTRMINLASNVHESSLASWQNRIIQTMRSQLRSSSSATHFSMSGSSGSSFGSGSFGSSFVSSSSSSSSSQSSQSSSSVSAWSNRFRRSGDEDGDEADEASVEAVED